MYRQYSRSFVTKLYKYFSSVAQKPVELSYSEYGKGRIDKNPLVLIHGLFGNKQNFNSVAKRLSEDGRKVITVCARNHGDSGHSDIMDHHVMAADLEHLLDKLNLDGVVLLGHSMGGKTIMTSALKHPEHLRGIIVGDVSPSMSPSKNLKSYAKAMRDLPLPQGVTLSKATKDVRQQLESLIQEKGVLDFLLTNLRTGPDGTIRWRINLDAIVKNYDHIAGFPTGIHATFKKPTIFIGGTKSPQISGESIPHIKRYFPVCQIEMIEGAGHWVHSDKPTEFLRIVNLFLSNHNL